MVEEGAQRLSRDLATRCWCWTWDSVSTGTSGLWFADVGEGTCGGMPFTYIIVCADGSYYVGSTWDLGRRVDEHNRGQGSAYTRPARRRPVKLAWSAEFERIEDAYELEKHVQGYGREKRQALIDGRIDDLKLLASRSWTSLEIKKSLRGHDLDDE